MPRHNALVMAESRTHFIKTKQERAQTCEQGLLGFEGLFEES